MSYDEKKQDGTVSSSDVVKDDRYYANEALVDPEEKESLHRDLSARQISMIAVRHKSAKSRKQGPY